MQSTNLHVKICRWGGKGKRAKIFFAKLWGFRGWQFDQLEITILRYVLLVVVVVKDFNSIGGYRVNINIE